MLKIIWLGVLKSLVQHRNTGSEAHKLDAFYSLQGYSSSAILKVDILFLQLQYRYALFLHVCGINVLFLFSAAHIQFVTIRK